MAHYELGELQERFADIVWEHEPIASGDLAKICEKELNWKRPTTYTVLRKLCEKGLIKNEDGIVVSAITRDQYYSNRSRSIIDKSFGGSLPAFIVAFTSGRKLTQTEIDELQQMIDRYREEN